MSRFNRFGALGSLAYLIAISAIVGCSGHVDLGTSVAGEAPKPTTSAVETAAQTTSLVTLNTYFVSALASDDSYLYLAVSSRNYYPFEYYLQRCKKSDCLHTLTMLRNPMRDFGGLRQASGKLGWVSRDGFALCNAPECPETTVLDGVVVQANGVNSMPTWDNEVIIWPIPADGAIYCCDMPRCVGGPKLVASLTSDVALTLVDEYAYWLGNGALLRTSKTETGTVEQLLLEAPQTTWVPYVHNNDRPNCGASELAIDGPWVYAALLPMTNGACGSPCEDCDAGTDLVRWRRDDASAERELILVDDVDFHNRSFMQLFDGEIVWGSNDGNLWSCLAEDCAATKRQFGVDGPIRSFDGGPTSSIVADDQFIYWLSASDTLQGMIQAKEWNLKRTPRLPK
ncbi:MAG TPA: hypothetical protein VIV60_33945 [Polyangiaceae bacterium]